MLKSAAAVLLLSAICINFTAIPHDDTTLSLSAHSAILIEADSGEVIYSLNDGEKLPMASTTKIMTTLVALESCEENAVVTVSPKAIGIEGSSCYLQAGEKLTVEQLLYAVMLASANDAAAAIAIYTAGSVEAFAALMNKKRDELKLTDTNFTNPHGLNDENHYTTAHELAILTRYALQNDRFREIAATKRKVIPLCGEYGARTLVNHNKMLVRYEGAIGVKTGFTKASGRCLVSAAERGGMTLIAVTLNAGDDWNDHEKLLDYGFANYKIQTLRPDTELFAVPVTGGEESVCYAQTEPIELLCRADTPDFDYTVELPRFLYAPVKLGQRLGTVKFYIDGEIAAQSDICAITNVKERSGGGFFDFIRKIFGK